MCQAIKCFLFGGNQCINSNRLTNTEIQNIIKLALRAYIKTFKNRIVFLVESRLKIQIY